MNILKVDKFENAIRSASNKLFNNKERIDALNVFPVPDGDTGSNMSSTFAKATELIEKNKFDSIGELIQNLSKNMLLSARGNSGVILSQIFKGFADAWKSKQELTIKDIISGFANATKVAYDSVLKPVEGTILTVVRETSEELQKMKVTNKTTVQDVFELAVKASRKSLENTPNLLPVLKEVGVVDSGGEGFATIMEGLTSALKGKFIDVDMESTKPFENVNNVEIYTGEFGYCTELIIEIDNPEEFSKKKFISKIEKLGNSIVAVNNGNILKIHIHTTVPGKILDIGQKLGQFLNVKIENMSEQANNTKSKIEGIKKIDHEQKKKVEKAKNNAIISCNSGAGFVKIMKDLECDYVIDGKASNNPSAQDIIEAIDIVNAKNILILPNNSNVILAAQQASKIKSDRNIHVITTKNQVEGITAIMNYSSEIEMKDNIDEIKSSLKNLVVGEIAMSAKDTTIDGIKIKKDHYLMVLQNKIIGTKKDSIGSAKALIDKMIKSKKRSELLSIYYGKNSNEADAKVIEKYVLTKYDIEVQINSGDQNLYDFMFGLE